MTNAWPVVELGTVAEISRSTVDPSQVDQSTPYVGLDNIERGGALAHVETVAEAKVSSAKFRFTRDHILFGKLRPYLAKVARPSFDGICSTDILPIAVGPSLDRNYLNHFLLLPQSIALANVRATGANLPRLAPKDLLRFTLPCPPISEQKRIARVLDAVELLRIQRSQTLSRLDELVTALFYHFFGSPSTNPLGWETVTLGELINSGPQNGLYKPAAQYGSGAPIIRIDSFEAGRFTKLHELSRVAVNDQELRVYGLNLGDILINRVNSLDHLGKSALVGALSEPTVFESNMMRFSVDENRSLPEFVSMFLQDRHIQAQVLSAAKQAVNQASINQKDVKALRIFLPPLNLQARFVDRLAAVDKLRSACVSHRISLDRLFESLRQRAFRGELATVTSAI